MSSMFTLLISFTFILGIIALVVFVCSEDRGLRPNARQAALAVGLAIAGIGLFTGVCALLTAINGTH